MSTIVNFGFGQVVTDATGETKVVIPGIVNVDTAGEGTAVNLGEGTNVNVTPPTNPSSRRGTTLRRPLVSENTVAQNSNVQVNPNGSTDVAVGFPGGTFNLDASGIRTDYGLGTVTVGGSSSSDPFAGPVRTNVTTNNGFNLSNLLDQIFG